MNYKITIVRKDPNPNYAVEYAAWEEKYNGRRDNFGNRHTEDRPPEKETITDALICELTEEQFKKIKAACITTFE